MEDKNQYIEILNKLLSYSEAILKGDYSKRIVTDVSDDLISQIVSNLNQYADEHILNLEHKNLDKKNNIDHFIEAISSFANHDFSHKLPITEHGTIMDAIATGINILGDELEQSTISKNYFSNIYNAVSEILIVTDLTGKVIDFNNATEQILGISKENYLNVSIKKLISSNHKHDERKLMDVFS